MIFVIYSIFDSAVRDHGDYGPIMRYASERDAVADFAEAVNDPKSKLGMFPADFSLFELGTFDTSNARFDIHVSPIRVRLGTELVRPRPTQLSIPDFGSSIDRKLPVMEG